MGSMQLRSASRSGNCPSVEGRVFLEQRDLAFQPFGSSTLLLYDVLDSTQQEAKRLFAKGFDSCVVACRHQTNGRGRWGRYWWSLPGRSLLFSLLFADRLLDSQEMTLLLAEATVTMLRGHGVPASVKWPNDISVRGLKCGGILGERIVGEQMRSGLVLGLGLNLFYRPEEFPPELRGKATAPFTTAPLDQIRLLEEILGHLERAWTGSSSGSGSR